MPRSLLHWLLTLVVFLLVLLVVCGYAAEAAVSQETLLSAIPALLSASKFSDLVAQLSLLPQVQQHARNVAKEAQNSLSSLSEPEVGHSALQYLHQLCLDAAEHLAQHIILACFSYIVKQDGERSAR
jgi:hypothetical protein